MVALKQFRHRPKRIRGERWETQTGAMAALRRSIMTEVLIGLGEAFTRAQNEELTRLRAVLAALKGIL